MAVGDETSSLGFFQKPRLVAKQILPQAQTKAEGYTVRRIIGCSELEILDPFVLLDDFSVSAPAAFADHPHMGSETVTYVLQGGISHEDFAGHKGTIHAGEVQWMTTGRGIVHTEMPAGEGVNTGLQLWINLPSKDKMVEPKYQELKNEDIPKAENNGVEVKVISGETMGVKSPACNRTPTMFLDFTLKPNARHHQGIPESWNAFVYVLQGEGVFGVADSTPTPAHHILVLGPGDGLSVWNKSLGTLRFILVGGQPLNEPVVQRGPFVMNTETEIEKSIEDYKNGKNGFELARTWRSKSVV